MNIYTKRDALVYLALLAVLGLLGVVMLTVCGIVPGFIIRESVLSDLLEGL